MMVMRRRNTYGEPLQRGIKGYKGGARCLHARLPCPHRVRELQKLLLSRQLVTNSVEGGEVRRMVVVGLIIMIMMLAQRVDVVAFVIVIREVRMIVVQRRAPFGREDMPRRSGHVSARVGDKN